MDIALRRLEESKERLLNTFQGNSNYDPFFIAEIGINHNGSIDLAFKLIDLAVEAGCDAVKFQKRSINIVYSKEILSTPRESPWGTTTKEQKEGLEFTENEYNEINKYCKKHGILWSASAWDIPSQSFLNQFALPFNKVASALATNIEFLEYVAVQSIPTFVSTGMMNIEDIDRIINIFNKFETPLCLFHTVSVYPCPEEELNLSLIAKYKRKYGLPVGYSGHETSIQPSLIATALGADAIERHITSNKLMYGSDQSASLEPESLKNLVFEIRKCKKFLGSGEKKFDFEEQKVAKKLRYWLD